MAALTMRVGLHNGPSLNPAVCWNIRESSPTLPQGVGDNGRGADYQQETELLARRKAGGAAEDPQRLYAGEPCCKQFHVQGWKVLDCVKSLSIRRTRLIVARIQEPVRSPGRPGSRHA